MSAIEDRTATRLESSDSGAPVASTSMPCGPSRNVEITAVCDPHDAARAARREGRRRRLCDARRDAGKRADATEWSSAPPPADHAAVSERCLARGLHVLCEKPLALTTWDVLTMLQPANRARRTALVASKFRHVPEVTRTRALLAAGEIGDPVSFEISFCSAVDMRDRWNAQSALSGGA